MIDFYIAVTIFLVFSCLYLYKKADYIIILKYYMLFSVQVLIP